MLLPFTVADYVDFYASEQHATNLGRMFRPDGDPLTPTGSTCRSATTAGPAPSSSPAPPSRDRAASGGQQTAASSSAPTERLDLEAELGFVVGTPTTLGQPVDLADFERHVFGVCLVNDWSARDIQSWEYVPLGPFLGKSFATSISPWVLPLAALDAARVRPRCVTFRCCPTSTTPAPRPPASTSVSRCP